MSNTEKTFDKLKSKSSLKERFNPLPTSKEGYKKSFMTNPLAAISESAKDVGMAFTPEIPVPEEETIIPLPNESVANLEARRRRARKAGSGRSSTILTEGLGG